MITSARTLFVSSVVLAVSASTARAQWTPPVGIPMPSFGVFETAPSPPSPWTTATPGFYYVDATQVSATDTSNPFGTPAKPRRTIPTPLPAGAVVELHGTYDRSHTSPATIVGNGTATSPVFIRGQSASAKPLVRNGWYVSGNYIILENLDFGPIGETQTGYVVMLAPINHAALRNSDLHGNLSDGGLGIVSWDATLNQNVVILNNTIHDNGDVNATFDQDVHGIVVNGRVSNLWVLDNQMYRNSGDGIQISAGSLAEQANLHHIYVGRNTSFSNKQSGFWVKQAVDVVFSQNNAHSHRPGNSSNGQCMGTQYATQWVWFLYNRVWDCEFGIVSQSDHDAGFGTESFFIGNVIANIHPSSGIVGGGDPWSSAGIMLAGGVNRRVLHNTMYDVNAGINVPGFGGSLEIRDNIISRVVAGANHVFVEDSGLALNTAFHHNLLEGDPRVRLGGSQQHLTAAQLSAIQSFGVDPLFVNPAAGDLHVQAGSKAIDTGDIPSAYTTYQQRYGVSILRDADGAVRPAGAAIDMGAFERGGGGGCVPTAPPAPTGLNANVSGTTVSLNWTAPSAGACNAPTYYWIELGTAPGLSDRGSGSTGSTGTSVSWPNFFAGTFYVRVKAADAAGLSPASNEVVVTVGGGGGGNPIPSPWVSHDIGVVGLTGTGTYASGTFTIRGAGSDIWGTSDSFRFVHQPLAADGQIVARVSSLQGTNPFAKAGIMIRQSIAPNAAHVILDVRPTGDVEFMTRATAGAATTWLRSVTQPAPVWLSLRRTGTTITASTSPDGSTWTQVGTTTLSVAGTVEVGLVVCSHDVQQLNTATFNNVTVTTGSVSLQPPTNLVGTVSGTTVTLTWNAPASGVAPTGYLLEVGGGPGRVDASVPLGTATTLTATGARAGTYYVRVRSTTATAASAPSNEVAVTVR